LTKLRNEFNAAAAAGKETEATTAEKLDKFKQEFADNAASMSKLQQAAEAAQKRADELEAKVVELERKGAKTDGLSESQLADAIYLAEVRDEVAGRKVERFGDEDAAQLPTAKEIRLAESAFRRYARKGDRSELGNMPEETLAVGSGLFNPSFGFAVPPTLTGRIINELYTFGTLRGLALERTVNSDSVKLMRFSGKTTVRVGREVTDWSAGDLPKGFSIEYPVVDYSVTTSLHPNIVEDANFDLVGFLADEARNAYGETEAQHHVDGDGHDKPMGILSPDKSDIAVGSINKQEAAFGSVRAIKSGVSGAVGHATASNAAFAFNPLIAALNSLHGRYRSNATILMSRISYAAYAMLRNSEGDYFLPADQRTASDGSMMLMGTPVRINDFMPDATTAGAYFAAIGDWRQAYEIATRRGVFMLVDPYSSKANVEYSLTWRTGGRPADTRAYRLLKSEA